MEKVFISDSSLNNMIRARQFELNGEWEKARELRKFEGQHEDVKAIDSIIEANRLGDLYRSKVAGAYEDYENRVTNTREFYAILTKAHKEVYG